MSSLREFLNANSTEDVLAEQLNNSTNTEKYEKSKWADDPNILSMPRKNDKGEGEIIIRPLPNIPPGDPKKWTQEMFKKTKVYVEKLYWSFTLNGVRVIFNSPISIGKPDPINIWRSRMYQQMGEDAANNWFRTRKISRKKSYYMNALVVKCESNPELEGQVKIFQFGAQLRKILDGAAKGRKELGIPPKYYWNPKNGYDVIVIAAWDPDKKQIHYNDSQLLPDPRPLAKSPKEEDAILDQVVSLDDYILNPDMFSSEEDIQTRLNMAIDAGRTSTVVETSRSSSNEDQPTMQGSSSPSEIPNIEERPQQARSELKNSESSEEIEDLFDDLD